MSIDANTAAQGLANLLFAQPNATATLDGSALADLATAIDTQMSGAIEGFIATLPLAAAALSADQLNRAMAYVAMKRAGMA